ncbi:MAG: AN1-type zinc finger domain-containing protein [Nitrososphaerota archaeon]
MKCSVCGRDELLPFKCKYCGEYFCAEHRLPEKHSCPGIFAAASPYEKEMKEVKIKIKAEEERLKTISRKSMLRELAHIVLSVILVSLVGLSLIGYESFLFMNPILLLVYIAGFALSYLLHELAHRLVASRNRVVAYFRLDPIGSLITLISAIPMLPIKFIAPGAVVLATPTTIRVVGSTSFWGPATNLILSVILYISYLISRSIFFSLQFSTIFLILAKFNAFIAFFNLLPFGPLDGLKIIKWSLPRWAVAFGLSIILLIMTM